MTDEKTVLRTPPQGARSIALADLPRPLAIMLERTPRAEWHRMRWISAQSPETHKILDIARQVDLVLPRSSLGVRSRFATTEERARKVQEMAANLDAFWSAVDALEAALEKLARSAGVWSLIVDLEPRRRKSTPPRPKIPVTRVPVAIPMPRPSPPAPVAAPPPVGPVARAVPFDEIDEDVAPGQADV